MKSMKSESSYSDRIGRKIFLLSNAWGMALLFVLLPLVTSVWHVYGFQIVLGVFGAMQKTCEKAILIIAGDKGILSFIFLCLEYSERNET